jgi:hypothetical protein
VTSDPSASQAPASPADPLANTEGSLIGRFVALLAPVFAIAAGWLAGVVATKVPGAQLNQAQIASFMAVAATSALTATWKWLQGWQQHEQLVSAGAVAPRKQASPPAPPRTASPR